MDEEQPPTAAHRIVSVFQKASNANRVLEQARLAKRAKRSAARSAEAGGSSGAATPSGAQTPVLAPPEPEKRLTKKDRKAAESKMSDVQQQKSANETARMAMGLGAASKFQKSYSWLKNGGAASSIVSAGQTANKGNAALNSAPPTPGSGRIGPSKSRTKQFGEWNESEDRAIQARDVLSALESDGKAVKAVSKGYNMPEKPDKR
jgi:Transcription initiation factor TFIID component TAF4 family